jgi:hypothetical protein
MDVIVDIMFLIQILEAYEWTLLLRFVNIISFIVSVRK